MILFSGNRRNVPITHPNTMITVAIINILIVCYAYLARNDRTKLALKISFSLIFLFLALRYDYGNDYPGYLKSFIDINRDKSIDYFDPSWHFEPGWVFLCRLFGPLGFFAMTAMLAYINCYVYYRFIEKNVPPGYYWLAVFLYVFSPGLMLTHSSAMRQSLAIAIFLFSIDYLYRKDAIRYFLCIAVASLIHASAIILFPLYLLGLFNWKINKLTAISIFSVFISLFLFGESAKPYLSLFISKYFAKYVIYQTGGKIGTGLGVIFYSLLFALVLFYERMQTKKGALIFKLAILSYLIMPFGLLIQMMARIGMYFQPAAIIAFPLILTDTKNSAYRLILLSSILFITVYTFYGFFQSDVWKEAFGTYKTIFSAPEVY